jgi:hypothetical protein
MIYQNVFDDRNPFDKGVLLRILRKLLAGNLTAKSVSVN